MTNYKNQHWLPFVALRGFSVNPEDNDRDNAIFWIFDGKNCYLGKIANHCYDPYHYSQSNPQASERLFWDTEGRLGSSIKDLLMLRDLTNMQRKDLIIQVFVLYFRNKAFQNTSKLENIESFNKSFVNFFLKEMINDIILPNKKEKSLINHELPELKQGHYNNCPYLNSKLKQFVKNWECKIIRSSDGIIWTSDNPVLIFNIQKEEKISLIIFPLTRWHYAIVYDTRVISISIETIDIETVRKINHLLSAKSSYKIFNTREFSQKVQNRLKTIFEKERIEDNHGIYTGNYIEIYPITILEPFSFFEIIAP